MKNRLSAGLGILALSLSTAHAGEWRVGPGVSVVTGLNDVMDLYENNYNNTHTLYKADTKWLLPFGLAVQGTYQWESGLRLDLGAGPFFMVSSDDDNVDLDHYELPVSATVGYTFLPKATVSPYVRVGLAHHFASGEYVEGSSPGLLAAAGIEFARQSFVSFGLEVAMDDSTVEFERYSSLGLRDTVELNTYDVLVSFYVKF